jgi:SAM-dependent methyltransferase
MKSFDEFAAEYDEIHHKATRVGGYPSSFFHEHKILETRRCLNGRVPRSILNYGCGPGTCEPFIVKHFPESDVCSVDISREAIRFASEKHKHLSRVRFFAADSGSLPVEGPFDLILVANVLHHVEPVERPGLLAMLHRHLAPSGQLFIFEHNPFNPLTQYVVAVCPFDEDAILLNPYSTRRLLRSLGYHNVELRFVLFFPAFLSALSGLERHLSTLPMGAQYCLIGGK